MFSFTWFWFPRLVSISSALVFLCFVSYLFPFGGVRVSIFGVLFVFALFVFPFFVSDLMSAPVVFVFGFGSLFMCFVFGGC